MLRAAERFGGGDPSWILNADAGLVSTLIGFDEIRRVQEQAEQGRDAANA